MKKIFVVSLLIFIAVILLAGCGTEKQTQEPNATESQSPPTRTPTLTSTLIPTLTRTPTTTLSPTITLTPTPTLLDFEAIPPGMYLVTCFDQKLIFRNTEGTIVWEVQIGETIQFASLKPNTLDVYFSNSRGEIWYVNLESREMEIFTDVQFAFHPDWSPDGNHLLYTTVENINYHDIWHINVFQPSTGSSRSLTDQSVNSKSPVWSPDGSQIVFLSDNYAILDTMYELQLMEASCIFNGNTCVNSISRLKSEEYFVHDMSWSPDGREIAFICNSTQEEAVDVCILNLESNNIRRIETENNEIFVSWSPDGEWLAVNRIIPGDWVDRVVLLRIDGAEEYEFFSEGDEYVIFWFVVE
jgi:Tol biopolymer transport system component